MTDTDIAYQLGGFWVLRVPKGYEVYRDNGTHSIRCARIGWPGKEGLERAKREIDRRLTGDHPI